MEEQLPLLLRRLSRTAVRLAHPPLERRNPLPEAQIEALHALASRGPLSPTQLAEALDLARPTISNLLRDLTNRGLVERGRSDTDGRAAVLSLTAYAETLMAQVHRRRVEAFADALGSLPAGARKRIVAALPALVQLQQRLDTISGDQADSGG